MAENGHKSQEHDKSVEIDTIDGQRWMDDFEVCPTCGDLSVVFIGRIQDEHGDWVDHWHCQNNDCDYYYEH